MLGSSNDGVSRQLNIERVFYTVQEEDLFLQLEKQKKKEEEKRQDEDSVRSFEAALIRDAVPGELSREPRKIRTGVRNEVAMAG